MSIFIYRPQTPDKKSNYLNIRFSRRVPGLKDPIGFNIKKYGREDRLAEKNPNYMDEVNRDLDFYLNNPDEVRKAGKLRNLPEPVFLEEEESADVPRHLDKSYGCSFAFIKPFWDMLEITPYLKNASYNDDEIKFRLDRYVFFETALRIISPDSKSQNYRVRNDQIFDFHDIEYRKLLDTLGIISGRKDQIVKRVNAALSKQMHRKINLALYDVTTFYFESFKSDELRASGLSKDGKYREVQVVLGLLIDEDGIPLTYELFPGNTHEIHTMIAVVKKYSKVYKIKEVTVVADSGLNQIINLHYLDTSGFKYIVGYTPYVKLTTREQKQFRDEADGWHYNTDDIDDPLRFGFKEFPKHIKTKVYEDTKKAREIKKALKAQKALEEQKAQAEQQTEEKTEESTDNADVSVATTEVTTTETVQTQEHQTAANDKTDCHEETLDNDAAKTVPAQELVMPEKIAVDIHARFIGFHSAKRASHDASEATKNYEKAKKKLEDNPHAGTSNSGCNAFIKVTGGKSSLNEELFVKRLHWAGYGGILTNINEKDVNEIFSILRSLWKIEKDFRDMKTELEARPCFVWEEKNVYGHFVICYLALTIVKLAEKVMKEKGIPYSFADVMSVFNSVKLIPESGMSKNGMPLFHCSIPTTPLRFSTKEALEKKLPAPTMEQAYYEICRKLGMEALDHHETPLSLKEKFNIGLKLRFEFTDQKAQKTGGEQEATA